jgi:hypothetical protein
MSTGEGIFLAGLAIAFALLLWNPDIRRIVGKSLKWIIGVSIVLGFGIWAYERYANYKHQKVDAPTDNPQLFGVKLGDTKNDVIYKKGEPKKNVDGDGQYENAMVYYDGNRVSAVFYSCVSDWRTELNGIVCTDGAEKVKTRFEGKIKEYCLSDAPTSRIFMVAEFNSVYILEKESVKWLGIKSRVGKAWVDCNTLN